MVIEPLLLRDGCRLGGICHQKPPRQHLGAASSCNLFLPVYTDLFSLFLQLLFFVTLTLL